MDHTSIISFLSGSRSAQDFAAEIAPEVEACIQGCLSDGVGHIVVTDGLVFTVSRDHAARLLQALADGGLTFDQANYLADSLIMSDDFAFADADVAEAVAFVADESRPPTVTETQQALARLA